MPLTAAEVLSGGILHGHDGGSVNSPSIASSASTSASPRDPMLNALVYPPVLNLPKQAMTITHGTKRLNEDSQHENSNTETAAAGALLDLTSTSAAKLSHNEVEHNRRVKAKQLFDDLRSLLPDSEASRLKDRNAMLYVAIEVLKRKTVGGEAGAVKVEEHCSNDESSEMETRSPGLYCDVLAGCGQWEGIPEKETAEATATSAKPKLSHSEAEQKRRLIARGYYNQMRALIPDGDVEKLDKNGILERAIEQLRRMRNGEDHKADTAATTEAADPPEPPGLTSKDFKNFNLSESPQDVVSGFINMIDSGNPGTQQRKGAARNGSSASSSSRQRSRKTTLKNTTGMASFEAILTRGHNP